MNVGTSQVAKVSFVDTSSETTQLGLGWNLVGNPLQTPTAMNGRFGCVDVPVNAVTRQVDSVRKWLSATSLLALYPLHNGCRVCQLHGWQGVCAIRHKRKPLLEPR